MNEEPLKIACRAITCDGQNLEGKGCSLVPYDVTMIPACRASIKIASNTEIESGHRAGVSLSTCLDSSANSDSKMD